jgi:uncharacterized surface protein with fasciclin (FAS1) repeats
MRTNLRRTVGLSILGVVTLIAISACSLGSGSSINAGSASTSEARGDQAIAPPGNTSSAHLVGRGCGAYETAVPSGSGSIQGMSQDAAGVAASNNPMLTTFAAAISGKLNRSVNILDSVNGSELTIFAPVDNAFGQINPDILASFKASSGAPALTKLLRYHLIRGQFAPEQLAGSRITLDGTTVKITGTGDDLRINGSRVICGGIRNTNATVYLIDRVLTPPLG